MIILLIRGFSNAGKDTLGKCFTENFGFTRYAFADSLKQIVSVKYGVSMNILHCQNGKREICSETGESWREILLREGRECREKDPKIFGKILAQSILQDMCTMAVITDWRFPNEYDVIKEQFPDATIKTILIHREGLSTCSPVSDKSEYLLIDHATDITVCNNGIDSLNIYARDIYLHIYDESVTG